MSEGAPKRRRRRGGRAQIDVLRQKAARPRQDGAADRVLEGVTEAAVAVKGHDRLMLAREQMGRRLRGRRAHSKLRQLVDLILARPLVSSAVTEKDLKVTTRG